LLSDDVEIGTTAPQSTGRKHLERCADCRRPTSCCQNPVIGLCFERNSVMFVHSSRLATGPYRGFRNASETIDPCRLPSYQNLVELSPTSFYLMRIEQPSVLRLKFFHCRKLPPIESRLVKSPTLLPVLKVEFTGSLQFSERG
jgi:hypothetical protein